MFDEAKVEEATRLLRQGLTKTEVSKRVGVTPRTLRRWKTLGKFGSLDSVVEKQARPKTLVGKTVKIETGCGTLYVTLNKDGSSLFEVFATLGKAGGCARCQNEAVTRAITLGLRCGIPKEEFVKEFRGIRCPNPHLYPKAEEVLSCADAIAKVIEEEG